jgi:HSP20 family molecular chaperone IbpA
MNEQSTCCQAAEESTAIRTRDERPLRLAEPAWNANRHDEGADVEIALPGVRKEDLSLEVRGSRLTLEARRTNPAGEGRLIHGEPAPDGYRLELRLGNALDGSALSARLDSGLLRVRIPLVEAAQPKRIEIR